MADVYLVYPTADADRAGEIGAALADCGWDVRIPDEFVESDRNELRTSRCVVVIWSEYSDPLPGYVRSELWAAKQRQVLVPVFVDDVEPPPGFRSNDLWDVYRGYIEIKLIGWGGGTRGAEFQRLKNRVKELAGEPAAPASPRPRPERKAPKGNRRVPPDELVPTVTPPVSALPAAQSLFLCYRREDTQGETGRLHDHLTKTFGPRSVFMDVDDVPVGVDYIEHVSEQLGRTAVMIVVMGRIWASAVDKKGRRRIDLADDLVRAEIAEALRRKIPIIPVLVHGVAMPDPDDLPDDIRVLARRNAIDLTHKRWGPDVDQLVAAIKQLLQRAGAAT